ncbi:MAG TPA: hypothetical protein VGO58_05525 [Chitinophagaceae bacterium]|jgi:protocatechuate 3,4-dioxygenase beta subunit|nr:hypothetical protein [Chitinophagaceae bacterium]
MKFTLLPCLLFWSCIVTHAQSDSISLLDEARTKLSNHSATVSSVLTDKKYLPIHPHTPFRQLIEANANSAILKIATPEEPGKKIRVLGTVTDKEGNALSGILIYLYQTDSRGWYAANAPHVSQNEGDMRHARLFGYVRTDAKGNFELHTIKPSGYPRSDLPAHIHIHVGADRMRQYVTELLFDDDDRLVGKIREQALSNKFIVAKPEKASVGFDQQFSYRLIMDKN